MTKDVSAESLMAVALQGLGLEYQHARAESGESLWHVPIVSPMNTVLTIFVGPFTAGVTCMVGDVAGGQVRNPLELLRLNANLTLAKVALRNEHLFVQAEIPTDQVSDQSLKLAITSVIDAIGQARNLTRVDVPYGAASAS